MNFNHHPRALWRPAKERKPVPAETITTAKLQIERKTFLFQLQENPRGQFLRITEVASERSNSIVIPATGLADFRRILEGLH